MQRLDLWAYAGIMAQLNHLPHNERLAPDQLARAEMGVVAERENDHLWSIPLLKQSLEYHNCYRSL